jgi:hypothetical protein
MRFGDEAELWLMSEPTNDAASAFPHYHRTYIGH